MHILRTAVAALIAAAALAGPALADSQGDLAGIGGVWRNPKNSVHVRISPCGDSACGVVVWASPKAQADARKGGTESLVGPQLFRNFAPQKAGVWRGKVFVPDLNMTLTGIAEPRGADALRARGCLLGSVLCKSQVWVRIDG